MLRGYQSRSQQSQGVSSSWSCTRVATPSISGEQELLLPDSKFEGWNFTSRLVDLPTIIESHKTIDSKTFYKTADICQLVLTCKEREDFDDEEDINSPGKKKNDPNKVEEIGPPLKNC
jgi:transcription initiation factor TFIID subunit 7